MRLYTAWVCTAPALKAFKSFGGILRPISTMSMQHPETSCATPQLRVCYPWHTSAMMCCWRRCQSNGRIIIVVLQVKGLLSSQWIKNKTMWSSKRFETRPCHALEVFKTHTQRTPQTLASGLSFQVIVLALLGTYSAFAWQGVLSVALKFLIMSTWNWVCALNNHHPSLAKSNRRWLLMSESSMMIHHQTVMLLI